MSSRQADDIHHHVSSLMLQSISLVPFRDDFSDPVAALERSDNVVSRPATVSLRSSAATPWVAAIGRVGNRSSPHVASSALITRRPPGQRWLWALGRIAGALLLASLPAAAAPAYLPLSGSAWRLALGDVDGDGRHELLCGLYQERLVCVDVSTGAVRWEKPLPGFPFAITAADVTGDGRAEVFVACADGSVLAFGPDGAAQWSFRPNAAAKHGVAVLPAQGDAPAWVVAAGMDRVLHAVDASTGRLAAQLDLRFAVNHLAIAALRRDEGPVVLALGNYESQYSVLRRTGGGLQAVEARKFPMHDDIAHGISNRRLRVYSLDPFDLDRNGQQEIVFGCGYTQGAKVLVHDGAGKPRWMSEAWTGPQTAGLERRDFYNMTFVRGYRPRDGAPRIVAVTGGNVRVFEAGGRQVGEANARIGFTDAVVDGATLFLGSSPNGDNQVYRIDLAGDWVRDANALERRGLAREMGETLAAVLRQAQALPPAPDERPPSTIYLGRTTPKAGETPIHGYFRREYPYPQLRLVAGNTFSGMVRGPHENVLLDPAGQVKGPRKDGFPREHFVGLARQIEASGIDQVYYISHGCEPRVTVDTLVAMLEAAPRHLYGFVTHEDENPERIPSYVGGYLAPLAQAAAARGRKLFSIQKNIWWFDTPVLPGAGERFFRPGHAPAIVAGTDDANSRTADLNLMARFGLRQGGLIAEIMSCAINDLHSYTRMMEWAYAKHGHPFFRLLVAHTFLGAQSFHLRTDNVHDNREFTAAAGEAFAPFLHLLGKGWVFAPRPDQMAGICPVGIVVHPPPPAWIKEAHNGHALNDWGRSDLPADAVLPHNATFWAYTPTPTHALTAALFHKRRQGGNHIPATPYGPVAFVPAHADRTKVAGVERWWHTDGVSLWRDGGPRLRGAAAAAAIRADLEAGAARLPFRPTGDDVFFHTVRLSPDEYRIVAIDPGWLDPAARQVRVRVQVPGAFRVRDLLTAADLPVENGTLALTVPAGGVRLLRAERMP